MASTQLRFDLFAAPGSSSPRVAAAVEALASQSGIEARGAIFARAEVVEFILDLAGYNGAAFRLFGLTRDGKHSTFGEGRLCSRWGFQQMNNALREGEPA